MTEKPKYIKTPDGSRIAYHKTEGRKPTVIFCGGYMSDMEGTKAIFLEKTCAELRLSFIRFDYSGHGKSSGKFEDGTIGQWKDDALVVIEQLTESDVIIIGSSMGGWIGLLVTMALGKKVKAFIGIAAAPDFTRELMWDKYSSSIRQILKTEGIYHEPSEYSDEPYKVSYGLIREGENHILLNKPIKIDCPIRLFHGLKDADVPSEYSMRISEKVTSNDVVISFNKSGDHRLSSPEDLERLKSALIELC
jgi:pimeloyl-ACP methyl ester carboxylesterase